MELRFTPQDRILVVAPHPDDELLGCAGVLQRAQAAGAAISILYMTAGDASLWPQWRRFPLYRKAPFLGGWLARRMGTLRMREAAEGMAKLSLQAPSLRFLGFPDSGLRKLSNIQKERAFRSRYTRSSRVPYQTAVVPGAPYTRAAVVEATLSVLRAFRPSILFVTHSSDLHSDHQAAAEFVQDALVRLGDTACRALGYLVHFKGWPENDRLPPPFSEDRRLELTLTSAELERKRAGLHCHDSQWRLDPAFFQARLRPAEWFWPL
jgi:LmbE family N-acetylglucosaminyl deacetylase